MEKKGIISEGSLSLMIGGLVVLCCIGWRIWSWIGQKNQETKIIFLNVGEGDAILISQGSNQVIIDSGRDGKDLLYRLGRQVPFWDRQIEMVMATHPDADHIGGFPSLFKAYHVEQVLSTGAESDTDISKLFSETAKRFVDDEQRIVFRGASIRFPYGGELIVEYPEGPVLETSGNTNEQSVVIRFVYGETSFLLAGDLPHEELVLLHEKPVTVLKASHHGSKYSTSDVFLDLVQPKEAVISVGKNMYGHPATETLNRLTRRDVRIYRTDEIGDVVYLCSDDHCKKS